MRHLVIGDLVAAALAASLGVLVRFGPVSDVVDGIHPGYPWSVLVLPAVWAVVLLTVRVYEQRFLWVGPEEFRRVLLGGLLVLAAVGTVSWALRLEIARGFVVVAVPLATVLTLLHRLGARALLHRRRRQGHHQQATLLVGHRGAVGHLAAQLAREVAHGYRVVGCCLPGPQTGGRRVAVHGVPMLGSLDEVAAVVQQHDIDTVAVLPCPELDGPALRRLGWDLEKTRAELLLAPAVTEVVGSRVGIRPVCGLPLLHMERPELRGIRRLTKSVVDRSGAALVLLLLAPVLLAAGLAVKLTSSGPVLFRQERVGRGGRTFTMLKFRSMVVGAERLVDDLAAGSDGNGVLFKLKADPRVTRVGRVLRRYSLDELPQLLNVLKGDMSLVGPRPPLQSEVDRYDPDMHRRFLVKPGITGLWQVSGRSDLSWDDSVRIDLRYVENWSLMFDFMILWKTIGAVFRGSGAY